MIAPIEEALSFGKYLNVSSNTVKICSANEEAILFASPGVISDSCITTGIFESFAASTTGTETNPPFENTSEGFTFFKIAKACIVPYKTLNGSENFS